MPVRHLWNELTGQSVALMYHCVGVEYPNGKKLTEQEFRRHLDFLEGEFSFTDLPTAVEKSSERNVALTFDGGYRNFYTNVYPILEDYGVPATVFVIPERLGNPGNPNSELWQEYFPYVTRSQLDELANDELISVGNKSLTHDSILPAYRTEERLRSEIINAKNKLEKQFGVTVNEFCYGSGRWDSKSEQIVSESHEYAVMTTPRFIGSSTDPIRIPRIDADLIDVETLEYRLSCRYVVSKAAHAQFNRVLGSSYSESDSARRVS